VAFRSRRRRARRRDHRAPASSPDPQKPLAKEHLAGGIGYRRRDRRALDERFAGAVAAYGSAGGTDLPIAVAPFILRASAVELWSRLGKHLLPKLEHDRA